MRRFRGPLWTILLSLLLGAGALWLSARLTWSESVRQTVLHGVVVDRVNGAGRAPELEPIALLVIAAIAAVLAIGGWPRRLLGVLVGLAGLACLWIGISGFATDVFGVHPLGYPLSQIVFAHVLPVVAGGLILIAGITISRRADRLPRLGARYQAPGSAPVRDPDAQLWQALSDGNDPTATE